MASSSSNRETFEQIIGKIPGTTVQFKKDKQGYVDLASKNKFDLLELITRQNKLLNNKVFISKLPDKGKKIKLYKEQLEEELCRREKSDDLSDMLLKLNINGKEALDKLEWNGNCNPGSCKIKDDIKDVTMDDVDEKTDPLKIFATHSGTAHNKKIIRVEQSGEAETINASVIEQLEANSKGAGENSGEPISNTNIPTDSDQLSGDEPYIRHLCDKFDRFSNNKQKQEKFLPHRSLIPHADGALKSNIEETTKKAWWEVTAATPPPNIYLPAKLISLDDSLKLQIQQAEHFKEVRLRHATERLRALHGNKTGDSERLEAQPENAGDRYLKFTGKPGELREPRPHLDSTDSSDDGRESYHSCDDVEEDTEEKGGMVVAFNMIDDCL